MNNFPNKRLSILINGQTTDLKEKKPIRKITDVDDSRQIHRKKTLEPEKSKYNMLITEIKKKIELFLDSTAVTIFMTLITIYALYFDDIRILFFPKSSDDIFFGITLIGMICFAMEIILASFAKDDYVFSFFFYLDIISTASMIPDCGWIWNAIIDSGSGEDGATDNA